MTASRAIAFGLLMLVLAPAPSPLRAAEAPAPPTSWSSTLYRDHPLAGMIWSAAAGRIATRAELADALAASTVVLFGEVHDNPDHRTLQSWAIDTLTVRGRRPAVVLEHIRIDQQDIVDAALSSNSRSGIERAYSLLERLDWDNSGWPPAAVFAPVLARAFDHRLAIRGGDPPRATLRAVAREGSRHLHERDRLRLGLEPPLDGALAAALSSELAASHCGLLPPAALAGMEAAQRYRDAHLADVVLSSLPRHGTAILLTGNGHVRTDRAVPFYLHRRAPGLTSVSVVLAEVEEGRLDPAQYVLLDPNGRPAVDFVWLTPRTDRPDPCASLRRQIGGGRRE